MKRRPGNGFRFRFCLPGMGLQHLHRSSPDWRDSGKHPDQFHPYRPGINDRCFAWLSVRLAYRLFRAGRQLSRNDVSRCGNRPSLGWLPILILVLGIDESLKIVILSKACFVPMAISISQGVRSIPSSLREVADVLTLSRRTRFFKLTLPAIMPFFFTGLRFSTAQAFTSPDCCGDARRYRWHRLYDGLGPDLIPARYRHGRHHRCRNGRLLSGPAFASHRGSFPCVGGPTWLMPRTIAPSECRKAPGFRSD